MLPHLRFVFIMNIVVDRPHGVVVRALRFGLGMAVNDVFFVLQTIRQIV